MGNLGQQLWQPMPLGETMPLNVPLVSFKGGRVKLEPLYFDKAFIFPLFCSGNSIMVILAHLKLALLMYGIIEKPVFLRYTYRWKSSYTPTRFQNIHPFHDK